MCKYCEHCNNYDEGPYEPHASIVPFILYGVWAPNKKITIRLGKISPYPIKTNKSGEWMFDLANIGKNYRRYKYIYLNDVKYKLDFNMNGTQVIKHKGMKKNDT